MRPFGHMTSEIFLLHTRAPKMAQSEHCTCILKQPFFYILLSKGDIIVLVFPKMFPFRYIQTCIPRPLNGESKHGL